MSNHEAGAAVTVETSAATEEAPPLSREQRRSRRHRSVRARTVSIKRLPKRELEIGRALFPLDEFADVERPRTRADCEGGQRPCPFVSCRHHLYLDVSARTGAVKLNFPDLEPDQLEESCALDVSAFGEVTLERVGEVLNLTRERVRQIEVRALAKIGAACESREFRALVEDREGATPKRRLPLLVEDEGGEQADGGDDAPDGADFDAAEFASDALDAE